MNTETLRDSARQAVAKMDEASESAHNARQKWLANGGPQAESTAAGNEAGEARTEAAAACIAFVRALPDGEAVAWQYRCKPDGQWTEWRDCDHENYRLVVTDNDGAGFNHPYEARELFATPAQATRVGDAKVWLLWKVYDYEGSSLLAAYASEEAAEAMAARCRAHAKAQPEFPAELENLATDDPRWETDPLVIAWDRDTETWRAAAPIDGVWGGDEFAITSEPILDAATQHPAAVVGDVP